MSEGSRPATPVLYPDSLYSIEQLSASLFIYFGRLCVPLPPGPIAPWALEIGRMIAQRRPEWGNRLSYVRTAWRKSVTGAVETRQALGPLADCVTNVYYSYGGGTLDLKHTEDLLGSLGLDVLELYDTIDYSVACGEVMRHLLAEFWGELENDTEALFDALAKVIDTPRDLERLLILAYYNRLLGAARIPAIRGLPLMLSRPELMKFFEAVTDAPAAEASRAERRQWKQTVRNRQVEPPQVTIETMAFELFQCILNPYVEPLTPNATDTIAECIEFREEEISALRKRCRMIVRALAELPSVDEVQARAEDLLHDHVAEELNDLLELGSTKKRQFLEDLAGDKAVWGTTLAGIWGALQTVPILTAAGVLGAIGSAAAVGTKTLFDTRRTLKQSDFRLVYRLIK